MVCLLKSILILPAVNGLQNRLFEEGCRDNANFMFIELKQKLAEQGYDLKTIDMGNTDEAEKIIIFDIPFAHEPHFRFFHECVNNGYRNKMFFIQWESPIVRPHMWNKDIYRHFAKIFTFNEDVVDNVKFFQAYAPVPFLEPVEFIPFAQRKLCTMISGNKTFQHPMEIYFERTAAIRAFERLSPYQFDLYGTGWNQPITQLQARFPFLTPYYPSYRGAVISKAPVLAQYKFCIAYENIMSGPGLGISGGIDKIHHPFMAGCVPIYLGATNITSLVPQGTFIDRRNFSSYEELYGFLVQMKETDYMQIINNIKDYLQSELYYKHFSTKGFVDMMIAHLIR